METQHVVGQAAAFAELTGTFLVGQTRFREWITAALFRCAGPGKNGCCVVKKEVVTFESGKWAKVSVV